MLDEYSLLQMEERESRDWPSYNLKLKVPSAAAFWIAFAFKLIATLVAVVEMLPTREVTVAGLEFQVRAFSFQLSAQVSMLKTRLPLPVD